jgi:hypothetical protein
MVLFAKYSHYNEQTKFHYYTIHGKPEALKQYYADRDFAADNGTLLFCPKKAYPGSCMLLKRIVKPDEAFYLPDLTEYNRYKALADAEKTDRGYKFYMEKADQSVNLEIPEEFAEKGTIDKVTKAVVTPEATPDPILKEEASSAFGEGDDVVVTGQKLEDQ